MTRARLFPHASPVSNIGRTFSAEFRWFVTRAEPARAKAGKSYRNPVALALEWRKAIDSGHYPSRSDLARKNGISRARVTQILNLLRMATEVIDIIGGLGDPLPSPVVTEKQLRRIVNLPGGEQLRELNIIIAEMHGGMSLRPALEAD
jgi:hypothetical protein